MRVMEGFILRNIADENIVMPIGDNVIKFKGAIKLNEVGATMWKALESDVTKDELVDILMNRYIDVNRNMVEQDVMFFLDLLDKNNLLIK